MADSTYLAVVLRYLPAILLLVAARSLNAQESGEQVRVTLRDFTRREGRLLWWQDSVVTLADTVIAEGDIVRLQVRRKTPWPEVMLIGVGSAGLVAAAQPQPTANGIFVALGLGLGTSVLGRVFLPGNWVDVPLPRAPPPN